MEISKGRRGGVWRDKEKKEKHEERERERYGSFSRKGKMEEERSAVLHFSFLSLSQMWKRERRDREAIKSQVVDKEGIKR